MKDRTVLRSALIAFASALVVSVSSVVYTGVEASNNNQQWCELLTTLDKAYTSLPPATALGKKVAKSIHDLRLNFDC